MLMSDLMQTVGILPILILIVAVFGFIAPNFFTESNLLNITRQASINIVLAAGMTFIILTGGIDLSLVHSRHHRGGGDGGVADP
jgi:ribose transport system permease protein